MRRSVRARRIRKSGDEEFPMVRAAKDTMEIPLSEDDQSLSGDVSLRQRKAEHLRIVLNKDVTHKTGTFLEDLALIHQALPELDLDEIDISCEFFGKRLAAPLMITSMTGGAKVARRLNESLARVASREGIAMAVGSQRVMIRHPETTSQFAVRAAIPDGVLLGNIGAAQLMEYPPSTIRELMERIEADGMSVHLNAAQELMQPDGERNFKGILNALARLVEDLDGRVLVKETGAGMSVECLRLLSSIGVKYIDVSGAGGTSWIKVEMHRATEKVLRHTAETFASWGIPTAFSIVAARRICSSITCVIASGGIANGLDAAKAIALGADLVGVARPALLAFHDRGQEGLIEYVQAMKRELRTAMLLTGAACLSELRKVAKIITGNLRQWLETYGWSDKEDTENEAKSSW